MNLSLCIAFVFGCVFTTRLFIVTRIWCVNDRRQSLTQCYVSETTPWCATGLEAKLIVTYQGTATDDDDESDADTAS